MAGAVDVSGLGKSFRVPVRSESGVRASIRALFHREHRTVEAVTDVSFTIAPGEVVGFLGANGAGKTTTLKMLAGLLLPSAGTARVLGVDPFERHPDFLRRITMVMGNRNQLQWDLPAIDSYELRRAIYRIPHERYRAIRDELIELLELGAIVDKPVRQLSLGERMRAELAGSLLHQPEVLFLDEPTLGLDVAVQRRVRRFVADYNARTGATILLTSHYMADVEALCRRVLVIHRGRLLFDGRLDELASRFSATKTITVRLPDDLPRTDADAVLAEAAALGLGVTPGGRAAGQPDAVAEAGGGATAHGAADGAGSAPAGGAAGGASDATGGELQVVVERDDTARVAALLLDRLPVLDVSIEDPPLEEVIEQVFSDG